MDIIYGGGGILGGFVIGALVIVGLIVLTFFLATARRARLDAKEDDGGDGNPIG